MAIIQSPVIGRAKKTAGGMVFTTLNGQNIMKSKPFSYRDLNTTVQQGNRTFTSDISKLAGAMKTYARVLFEKQPTDMPAFSKMQKQLLLSRSGDSGAYVFEPTGKEIGSGSIQVPLTDAGYTTSTGGLDLTWDDSHDSNGALTGKIPSCIVINKSTKKFVGYFEGANPFEAGEGHFSIPTGLTATQLSVILIVEAGSGAELVKSIKFWKDCTAS